jgi:hypothetical protein
LSRHLLPVESGTVYIVMSGRLEAQPLLM